MQMLWFDPGIARGVLQAARRAIRPPATIRSPTREPGKILHEMRGGEMAALREVPFGLYYGSVDSTPLFVLLAGLYAQRTGDIETLRELWPNIEAALGWIDGPGDPDGDGFVEYHRATEQGLANQGWKDSQDAVFHADGRLAEGPIALAEVQGYVYAAKRAGGALRAPAWARTRRRDALERRRRELAERFEEAFWCPEIGTYALALDGHKRPCAVRTSNAGQVLFTGIAQPERAARSLPRSDAAAILHRLGHPHRRGRGAALQSDVLSQWLGLAARQCADRAWLRPLRARRRGRAGVQGHVRRRDLHGSSPPAGIVLRLPPRAAARGRRSIRSPARRRPGPRRRRSPCCRPRSAWNSSRPSERDPAAQSVTAGLP